MSRTERGVATKWFREHVHHQGDDCLIWPYFRDTNGYGRVTYRGSMQWAHRAMCREAHGEPPTWQHQAAHTCGRGKFGCVNPHHLVWKTPSENSFDMRVHGTAPGAGRPFAKLTWEAVAEIRFLKDTLTEMQLAEMFGVTPQNIGHIVRGETWRSKALPTLGRRIGADSRAELVARALQLRQQLKSYEEIARTLGVSRGTARQFVLRHTEP